MRPVQPKIGSRELRRGHCPSEPAVRHRQERANPPRVPQSVKVGRAVAVAFRGRRHRVGAACGRTTESRRTRTSNPHCRSVASCSCCRVRLPSATARTSTQNATTASWIGLLFSVIHNTSIPYGRVSGRCRVTVQLRRLGMPIFLGFHHRKCRVRCRMKCRVAAFRSVPCDGRYVGGRSP